MPTPRMPMTPYDLLRAELDHNPGRPFLTFYDDASGARIELSVATFDNWVAKTAGLLRDGLSAAPGDRLAIELPAHWQALAWVAAGWAVGVTVVLGPDRSADVCVVGPDGLDGLDVAGPEVVALALRPLGGRFADPLPAGVLDYALEVPGYPDRLVPYVPPAPEDPALESGGAVARHLDLVDQAGQRAAGLGVERGARLLVPTDGLETAVQDALLLPLVTGGSAVLVRHEDPGGRDARVAAERVTSVVG